MATRIESGTKLLESALDDYLDAWRAVDNAGDSGNALHSGTQISLDGISEGLHAATLYEKKLKQAKAIVARTRNTSLAINMLPEEVLARILYFALCSTCPRHLVEWVDSDASTLPLHANTLSRVCTRWRRITANSSRLWTRIDLSIHHPYDDQFLSRATVSVSKVGTLPLDVQLIERVDRPWRPNARLHAESNILPFCVSIAPQMRSLGVICGSRFKEHYGPFLDDCLANCVPGILTMLNLAIRPKVDNPKKSREFVNYVIATTGSGDTFHTRASRVYQLQLEISHAHFEELLRPVRVLRLCNIYIHWASEAYHGLEELRLTCKRPSDEGVEISITEAELAVIFKACPALRIFHFGLAIPKVLAPTPPVQLNHLEELVLSGTDEDVLRLITPGATQIQMTVKHYPSPRSNNYINFFAQFNIVQLALDDIIGPVSLFEFLELIPTIRTLILRDLCVVKELSWTGRWKAIEDLPLPPRLTHVHLTVMIIDSNSFWRLARAHQIQKITAHRARIHEWPKMHSSDLTEYVCQHPEILSVVEFTDKDNFGVGGWY